MLIGHLVIILWSSEIYQRLLFSSIEAVSISTIMLSEHNNWKVSLTSEGYVPKGILETGSFCISRYTWGTPYTYRVIPQKVVLAHQAASHCAAEASLILSRIRSLYHYFQQDHRLVSSGFACIFFIHTINWNMTCVHEFINSWRACFQLILILHSPL
jgi:hypothetical protein